MQTTLSPGGAECSPGLSVRRIRSFQECQSLAETWNALASDIPFRRWEWLGTWWQHYGHGKELYVLVLEGSDGRIRAIAPWYLDPARGRCLRFLGDGKACSDYLTILCSPADREVAAESFGDWLSSVDQRTGPDRWNAAIFEAIPADDLAISRLIATLRRAQHPILEQEGASSYALLLPETQEAYFSQRSKSNRHQLRRVWRRIEQGELPLRSVTRPDQLDDETWELFVDLHQLRRRMQGEAGCFDFPPFGAFLRAATDAFLAMGGCHLAILHDGPTPMSALLMFFNQHTTYMYQSGMDAGVQAKRPGYSINGYAVLWTIQRGARCYDFLRGDETYKETWRAQPIPTKNWRISSRQPLDRMRHGLVAASEAVADWLTAGWTATTPR